MATIKQLFITAMVDQQQFVEELHVVNDYNGFDDVTPHPFKQYEETKLIDLFSSTVAEHCEITEDMIKAVLSDYTQRINGKLKELANE